MNKKYVAPILITFLIVLSTIFSFYYYDISQEKKNPALAYYGDDEASSIRPFTLLNQDGDTITEQNLKNKIVIAEFFFATCKGICPIMNEQMARIYETVRTSDDVIIVSHTVDPENDSPENLKQYSKKFNADAAHWMFLTGDKATLYNQAMHTYKIGVEENKDLPLDEQFIHAPDFVLIDKQGKLRASRTKEGVIKPYDGTDTADVSRLIQDIQKLIKES